ncbi:MAG UNVERIFIED_CONTAM: protein kinase [Anaerolineae bacterium]
MGAKGKILYGLLYQRVEATGRYLETKHVVVIKKLSKPWIRQRGIRTENPFSEMAVAQIFGDDVHIVRMYDTLQDARYLYMVMPYMGNDLHDSIPLNQQHHVPLLTALVDTLVYLKQNRIIHRDFSPENVIFCRDEQNRIRGPLIDFAMALQCETLEGNTLSIIPQEMACGKWPYMSPEVANGEALDFGVDIWALGCTLFLLWTGQRLYEQPFDRSWQVYIEHNGIANADDFDYDVYMSDPDLPPDFIQAIAKLPYVQALTDDQRDLLSKMLTEERTERITAEQILQHDYIRTSLQE